MLAWARLGLKELPKVEDPGAVVDLDAGQNYLSDPLPAFSGFVSLTSLNLGANELASVPDLSACVSLVTLLLNNNMLTLQAPGDDGRLAQWPRSLREISLRQNRITTLLPLQPVAPFIEVLSASSNSIASLDEIPPLPACRTLHLHCNAVTGTVDVAALARSAPVLRELGIAFIGGAGSKPFSQEAAARVLEFWPNLEVIDGDRYNI